MSGAGRLAAGLQHHPAALETGRAHPRQDPRCHNLNHQQPKQETRRLSGYIQGSTSP